MDRAPGGYLSSEAAAALRSMGDVARKMDGFMGPITYVTMRIRTMPADRARDALIPVALEYYHAGRVRRAIMRIVAPRATAAIADLMH